MGKVTPIGDSAALAEAILAIARNPEQYRADPQEIARRYQPDSIAAEYEQLFERIQKELQS